LAQRSFPAKDFGGCGPVALMRSTQPCLTAKSLAILATFCAPACVTDSVPPDIYAESSASSTGHDPESSTGPESQPPPESNAATPSVVDPADLEDDTVSPPPSPTGAAPGSCDLTGRWLISQRTVAVALGVKQRGMFWFYYELEQDGSELTVTKGLVCGSQVFPLDALAAAVDFSASFPAIVANNSHAGREGRVVSDGSRCTVTFDRAYSVVGATMPYYSDATIALPTLEERASGTSPGWEDWDEDGQPAVSLHVSGLATGERYTVLRAFSDWSGTISAGATTFQLAVPDWGQDEAVLGATSDLLKQTGVPDPDRTGHFVQFAQLTPEQVQGDDETVCATVRRLYPTLTPATNR
jgi:hypothetical protein